VAPGRENLLLIKNDSIVLSNGLPSDKELNIIKGKITEIIPSQFGKEVIIDAGELFYVNALAAEIENLRLREGNEVWMSFSCKDIVIVKGN
jgi:molybdopterin-binding protein